MTPEQYIQKNKGFLTLFSILLFTLFFSAVNATTYTASNSGNWSSETTWAEQAPGTLISGDQVIIPSGITVSMDQDITFSGGISSLEVAGTLAGSNYSMILAGGTLSGTGMIILKNLSTAGLAAVPFTGNLVVTHFVNTARLELSALIAVQNSLQIAGGYMIITSGGTLNLEKGVVIELSEGELDVDGGTIYTGDQGPISGLNEAAAKGEIDFEVFPNPAKDWVVLNITQPSAVNLNLDIFDSAGRLISASQFSETRKVVDLTTLASGTYFFKVWDTDNTTTAKIIKE